MSWLIWIYIAYSICIAPVTIQYRFEYNDRFAARWIVHLWGIPLGLQKPKGSPKGGKKGMLPQLLLKERAAIKGLFRGFQWQFVSLQGCVAASSADLTAYLWGAGKGVLTVLEARLRQRGIDCYFDLQPAFDWQRTQLSGGCILFVRLGNLLLSSLQLGLACWRLKAAQKEEKVSWSTPSGA
ncbi:MAG: hypothetical protein IJF65_01535 [Clostridia bacterium]|nr:hypothetical protein [Clostridia bacterium]